MIGVSTGTHEELEACYLCGVAEHDTMITKILVIKKYLVSV